MRWFSNTTNYIISVSKDNVKTEYSIVDCHELASLLDALHAEEDVYEGALCGTALFYSLQNHQTITIREYLGGEPNYLTFCYSPSVPVDLPKVSGL